MVFHKVIVPIQPHFAESKATRRGKLIGYFLGAVIILIAGIVLVIRNRKK